MNKIIKNLIIIILINLFTTKIYSRINYANSNPDTTNSSANSIEIKINPITFLNGMTKKEIADFRKEKVKEYSYLNIFPENYDPLIEPQVRIYNQITDRADWVHDTQFYICNPYLLIIVTQEDTINALNLRSDVTEIKYTKDYITELYRGSEASDWFYYAGNNSLRIWMVNAYDAGFCHINVDLNKSKNIATDNSPSNIINSIYSNSAYYHVGRYQKNNISPADRNARITLIEKDVYTKIYIKLWRTRPKSKDDKEDFAYIFEIIP